MCEQEPRTRSVAPEDFRAVATQLGREPRGLREVAHRCECGLPDVVSTDPRLPDGSPFPTFYYLTCPKVTSAVSTLEAEGVMRTMQNRLASDIELSTAYQRAHEDYLGERAAVEAIDEIDGISAGGMPERVKCLHVLVAHSLARGPGANPLGDEVLQIVTERGLDRSMPCIQLEVDS